MSDAVWWIETIPAHESAGGLAKVLSCMVCGAAVVVTQADARTAELHIEWHGMSIWDRAQREGAMFEVD